MLLLSLDFWLGVICGIVGFFILAMLTFFYPQLVGLDPDLVPFRHVLTVKAKKKAEEEEKKLKEVVNK